MKSALALFAALALSPAAHAAHHYVQGTNLACTGTNELLLVNVTAKTLTRNGVVFTLMKTDSFFGPIFSGYDTAKNQMAPWALDVLTVDDANGPGQASIGDNVTHIQVQCREANADE
jgi:hypothetical protein